MMILVNKNNNQDWKQNLVDLQKAQIILQEKGLDFAIKPAYDVAISNEVEGRLKDKLEDMDIKDKVSDDVFTKLVKDISLDIFGNDTSGLNDDCIDNTIDEYLDILKNDQLNIYNA